MSQNILVAVRIRPDRRVSKPCATSRGNQVFLSLPTTEQLENIRKKGNYYQPKILSRVHSFKQKNGTFRYDYVFGSESTQEDVYENLGKIVLKNCFLGYNATLFAYGQTGSGKTFTCMGPKLNCPEKDEGIIPRLCRDIFSTIESLSKEEGSEESNDEEIEEDGEIDLRRSENTTKRTSYSVSCSMIEIYNEKIKDLLCKSKATLNQPNHPGLEIREHPHRGWTIPDLSIHPTKSSKRIQKLITRGGKNRTIAQTKMNDTSSRAHTIFQIRLTKTERYFDRTGKKQLYSANTESLVNLVDLAGSEQMTTAVGSVGNTDIFDNKSALLDHQKRKKELIAINVSLSCLGLVITKLARQEGGDQTITHIPYRNSKLTKLLSDSLGGNAKAIMIATLSPNPFSFEQTLSTCRYANRVKSIKNRPIINQDPKEKIIKELRQKILELQKSEKNGILLSDLKELNLKMSKELEEMSLKHAREKEMHLHSNLYLRQQNKVLKRKIEERNKIIKETNEKYQKKLENLFLLVGTKNLKISSLEKKLEIKDNIWKKKYSELKKKYENFEEQVDENKKIMSSEITVKQDRIKCGLSQINRDMKELEKTINNIWNGGNGVNESIIDDDVLDTSSFEGDEKNNHCGS